jgi:predicted nuclease with TOPRIM domain
VLPLACVTRGTHEAVVGSLEAENSRLEQRVGDLERSNSALDDERTRLIDEMEDMRQARDALSRDVAKLQRSKTLLTEHLRTREAGRADRNRAAPRGAASEPLAGHLVSLRFGAPQ